MSAAHDAALAVARELLAGDGVLAFATESSYGLGVDPRSKRGVEAIYQLKGRERGKPLPVVAADLDQLLALGVEEDSPALAWAVARWPAPLTVLLPMKAPLPAAAGIVVAARVPARPSLRTLLTGIGTALTATSANRSSEPAMSDPVEVAAWLGSSGQSFHLFDEGPAPGGAPSTLVDLVDGVPRVLRAGGFRVD